MWNYGGGDNAHTSTIYVEALFLLLRLDRLVQQCDRLVVEGFLEANDRELVVGQQDLPPQVAHQLGRRAHPQLIYLLQAVQEVVYAGDEVTRALEQYAPL